MLQTPVSQTPVSQTPVSPAERIVAIDVLRGVALLGILVMNIQAFAMPDAAYLNPYAYGDLSGANGWVWRLSHVLAFGKFISIFAMLFGAGIVLRDGRGASTGSHYRRMAALLVIGLLHAYLLWFGDILFSYALLGMIVFTMRGLSPRTLLIVGICGVVSAALVNFGLGGVMWLVTQMDPSADVSMSNPQDIQDSLDAYRGGWLEQMPHRATMSIFAQTIIFALYSLPFAGGLMCVGMALMRLGFFAGAWSRGAYAMVALVGCGVGWSGSVLSLFISDHFGNDEIYRLLFSDTLDYLSQPFAALGYAAVVIGFIGAPRWLGPVAAVGRTALSCYLLQTLICTTLFYGHGLGWFGSVDRVGQMKVVLCVWAVLLIVAPVWLKFFRFGPMEWVWRRATYLNLSRETKAPSP
jgi:uncharacterized protein